MPETETRVPTYDPELMRQRFDTCVELRGDWEKNALRDLKFKAGTDGEKSYQWDQTVQSQRNSENLPCLTINRIPSFIKQVVNQQRQAGPTIQVEPVGDEDEDVAEVLQGMIRHIVNSSDGEIGVDTAYESAVSAGVGYVVVVPEYIDADSNVQELRLDWVPNVFSIYLDPAAVKPDRSDARFGFRISSWPVDEYEAVYGKLTGEDLALIGNMTPSQNVKWFPKGQVIVADYYELKEEKRKDRRPGKKSVIWRTVNGLRELDSTVIPISRIPIVPCFGDQVFLEGKEDWRGMIRDGIDAQMGFNYWYTAITIQIAMGSKSPFILDPRQIEGMSQFWDNANREHRAYLPAFRWLNINPDQPAVDAGFPQRDTSEPPIEAMTVALNYADQALKQVMNLYEPSLGQRKSEQSGRAILALQQQGEIGNANYIDNLKRFLRSLGRLILEMIPVYYDAPRVVRITGKDEKPRSVMVHAGTPPDQIPPGVKKVYDLSTGRYDIVVSTGPSFVTKRQEQLQTLIDYLKVDPRAAAISGDIIAKLMEIPEMEQRMKKALPPQFQEDGDPQADANKLRMQLQQQGQVFDAMQKELAAKTDYIKTEQAKYGAQVEIEKAKAGLQIELQRLKNAATISVAEINAQTKGVISANEAQHEAIALATELSHDAQEAHLDRQHETAMAGAQASAQAAEGQADRTHEADLTTQQQAADAASQQRDLDAAAQQAQTSGTSEA